MDVEEPGYPAPRVYTEGGELCVDLPVEGMNVQFVLKEAYLAFFNGREIKSRFWWKQALNRAIGHYIRGYTHVEFAFRFVDIDVTREIWVACLIFQGERLHFEVHPHTHPRQFKTHDYLRDKSESLWTMFPLNLDKQRLESLYHICMNDVQRNLFFNTAMYYNFFVPRCLQTRDRLQQSTFCSEYVSTVLQRLQMRGFEDIEPHVTDPLTLYQRVLDCGHYKPIRVSRARLDAIMAEGGLIV